MVQQIPTWEDIGCQSMLRTLASKVVYLVVILLMSLWRSRYSMAQYNNNDIQMSCYTHNSVANNRYIQDIDNDGMVCP